MPLLLCEKTRKQEINEALGLFSLWVADSNKKQRCSPTKKMNRNNLMLTAWASNRQCLTAWQRSRCWWLTSSPTWTWSSARTSSPSTNLCWPHTPNYSQVEEPSKYLFLCVIGLVQECLANASSAKRRWKPPLCSFLIRFTSNFIICWHLELKTFYNESPVKGLNKKSHLVSPPQEKFFFLNKLLDLTPSTNSCIKTFCTTNFAQLLWSER